MLHFRGSDCKRSRGSTWYGRMDRFLMNLGFIESKVDSNLCFKVEGEIPVMLLLCVDALRSRHRGVDKGTMSRDAEEVQDDGLQGQDHIYGIEHEAIDCCFIRDG